MDHGETQLPFYFELDRWKIKLMESWKGCIVSVKKKKKVPGLKEGLSRWKISLTHYRMHTFWWYITVHNAFTDQLNRLGPWFMLLKWERCRIYLISWRVRSRAYVSAWVVIWIQFVSYAWVIFQPSKFKHIWHC